jgi:hypothetical protein
MANSYIEYTSGLTGTTFSVPFKYISIDDVQALGFDGEKYSALTIASRDNNAKTITLDATPSTYAAVRLYRASAVEQLVDFQNGSRLSERDLDTAYQQGLFAAQEVAEDANTVQFQSIREGNLLGSTNLVNFASSVHTGDDTTTVFNLSFNPRTVVPEAFVVSIDGVLQSPTDAYTLSITPAQITFTAAPPAGSKIVVVTAASAASATSVDDVTIGLTNTNQVIVKDGAVSEAKIADGAVSEAKIADGAVTPAKLSAGAPTWSNEGILEYVGNDTAGGLGNTSLTLQASEDAGIDAKLALGVKTGNTPFIGAVPATGSTSASLAFYTYDVERMRLNNNGTLYVGRSSTQTTSKIRIDNYATNYGYGIDFYGKSGQASFTPLVFRSSSGGIVGSVTNGNTSTSYNTSSDYRLKEDIIEIDDSIERLKELKPCNFRWKSDGTRVDGFLAHEAQEVVPEAVTGTKDAVDEEGNPDYQGIDQAKLVPLLTKALQEAVAEIESLKTRVEALENA